MVALESFRVQGGRLAKAQDLVIRPKVDLKMRFLSLVEAQRVFQQEGIARQRLIASGQNAAEMVIGEVDGQLFIMEAAQAQSLMENAVDQAALLEQLKP
jgi:hypothetical protein